MKVLVSHAHCQTGVLTCVNRQRESLCRPQHRCICSEQVIFLFLLYCFSFKCFIKKKIVRSSLEIPFFIRVTAPHCLKPFVHELFSRLSRTQNQMLKSEVTLMYIMLFQDRRLMIILLKSSSEVVQGLKKKLVFGNIESFVLIHLLSL